jgi:soluble lytic murein transglycosylase-like protein
MARRAAIAVSLAVASFAALPWTAARADRQMDPELRGVIANALVEADCFADKYDRAVWFALMEPRLARYVKHAGEREQILHNVHCEARRVDIPPELVLAVMDVESRFDRYAVSSAGAVGLMQVMPFWPRELGMTNDQLVRIDDNVRMGTTILGYYLRKERGNYQRALQRYNGSLGRPTYSDLVIDRLVSRWRYEN